MRIQCEDRPRAGQQFMFRVTGATGKTRIEAHVDTRRVLETECPDPPCHEMVQIPAQTRDSILRLIAIDSIGNREELEFIIADSEAGAGGVMVTTS